ncbi:MAG: hypothetical protein ACXWZ2_01785 [Mycobacterium sp.]
MTVPVSAGLLVDTRRYFDSLTAYREGNPAAIVKELSEASFTAIAYGRRLVNDLQTIRDGWNAAVQARRGASVWRLADLLLRQPVLDATTAAAALEMTPQNVLRAIAPLVDAGVLVEFTGFKRNRMWQSNQVLAALDAFAARAGRRGGG